MDFEPLIRAELRAALPTLKAKQDVFNNLRSEFKKQIVIAALHETRGNMLRAANLMNLNRNTFRKMCTVCGVEWREIYNKYLHDRTR